MKICILSEEAYGNGAAIASYRLAEALSNNTQHDIFYIFNRLSKGIENVELHKYPLVEKKYNYQYILHCVKKFFSKKLNKRLYVKIHYDWCFSQISRLIDTIKPDIINLHNVSTILRYEDIITLSNKAPIIWTMHDAYAIKAYSYMFQNYAGKHIITVPVNAEYIDQHSRIKMLNGNYDIQFITPSIWLRNNMLSEKETDKKINVISNGLSKSSFFPEDKKEARKLFKLDVDGFYLLFIASDITSERKNLQCLLKALEIINDSSIKLLAIGEMKNKFKIHYKNIYCFPPQFSTNYLRTIYACADFFVITSLIDNLPNTVLESIFCGIPVIGSNTGGIPEMVIQDKTGYLFNPYSPSELAKTIIYAKHHQKQFLGLRSKHLDFDLNNYSITTQKERYLKLFQNTAKEFKMQQKKEIRT